MKSKVVSMVEDEKPLVSCLMLTHKRFGPFKKALECFLKQTYTNKELVIVCTGSWKYHNKIKKLIHKYNNNNIIRMIYSPPIGETIGKLRNIGLEYCKGEYIMIFDDDDIHHSSRIEKQIDLCLKSNIQGTLLKNFIVKYYWKEHKCSNLNGLEGTLLFKKCDIKYDDISMGEDTNFIQKLKKKNGFNICVIDEPFDTYKYIFYGNNTVGKKHFKELIQNNHPVRK